MTLETVLIAIIVMCALAMVVASIAILMSVGKR